MNIMRLFCQTMREWISPCRKPRIIFRPWICLLLQHIRRDHAMTLDWLFNDCWSAWMMMRILCHSGLQQSAMPHLRVSVGDSKVWHGGLLQATVFCLLEHFNSLVFCHAIWCHNLVNTGWGNGLVLWSAKPLPKVILTGSLAWGPMAFTWRQFH